MSQFEEGDRVRIDIPDTTDPDHDNWHGLEGVVVGVFHDDAGQETNDERDGVSYRIEFEEKTMDFRWRDVRPAFDEENDG